MTQYCVGANYTWLLVEGIYLHRLLVLVGGSEGGHFRYYLLLGWGEPRPYPLPSPAQRASVAPLPCWFASGLLLSLGFCLPIGAREFRGSWAWRGPCAR